jgi:predicted PurR-regulated permease PerM
MTHDGHTAGTESAPAMVQREGQLATGERFRPFALAALTLGLVALCVLLAVPFLSAITWGVALAVVAWPLHAWVRRRLVGSGTWAAALTTLVVILAVALPGAFVVRQVGLEAASAARRVGEGPNPVRQRLARTPGMSELIAWADGAGVDLDAEVRKGIQSFLGDPAALAQGSITAALQAVIAAFILFYLLRDRRELLAAGRRVLPMRRPETDRVFTDAAGSVYANLYANLVTSLIDAVTGGLLFWALGLPSPVTWAVVMFVLSMLPVAGIFLVWVPAAVYLALAGNWGGALALVAWGVGSSVLVDTLLYTRLAGNRMRLHPVPALIAFVGGIVVFGASGMVLGPAIVAVTAAVLDVWHYRAIGEEVPKSAADEPEAAKAEPAAPPRRGPSLAPSG